MVMASTLREPKANAGGAGSVSRATSVLGGLRKDARALIGMIKHGQYACWKSQVSAPASLWLVINPKFGGYTVPSGCSCVSGTLTAKCGMGRDGMGRDG